MKHMFWKKFPKRVLLRDFAFKHKLGTLMPKTSFEIGEFLKEVKSIFDFKVSYPTSTKKEVTPPSLGEIPPS